MAKPPPIDKSWPHVGPFNPHGRVLVTVERAHRCRPGWGWCESTGEGLYPIPAGATYGVPPDPWRFPTGTIWECSCGITWVSTGSPALNSPGICGWRLEGRFERWRRRRAAR